ncbi:MAG: 50S ribosomal protein L5 [Candidatus Auribacterota bacterium]|nr:50S ribosomal protein L5 [Candidatus Auribacterota bacterium]
MARLKDLYKNEIQPALKNKFGYKNIHQIPKLEKVVVNMGVGEGAKDKKVIHEAANELALITGQKPAIAKARKSIAGFKLREGSPIGCKVTLRGDMMYEFIDRLINVALPRVRDFRGVPNSSFDGRGNYSFGVEEQLIFPEIDPDKAHRVQGMDITFVTTAKTDEEAKELFLGFGVPFSKEK